MNIIVKEDTIENRIEHLNEFKKHWTFSKSLYDKALKATKDGKKVHLVVDQEKEKVIKFTIS